MAVVVSDTTPLHYLILIGADSVLGKLYGQVFVPPAVMQELSHPAAPPENAAWIKSPPVWLLVQTPWKACNRPQCTWTRSWWDG